MKLIINLSALFIFLGCFAAVTHVFGELSSHEQTSNNTLYFSLVPKKNVDQQIDELQPLLQLLEEQLGIPIKIIRPQSYYSVIEGILSQTIDFAIMGPASYAKARARDERIEAFASFAKEKGLITPRGSFYSSVLFTLRDFGHDSIEDLKGKKVALTDPSSTSGSVIPNIFFTKDIGSSLKDYFSSQVYTGSHDRSIKVVQQNYVDAAFVSSVRIDEAVQKGTLDPDQVVVLWRSKPIPFDPFVFRSELDESIKAKIIDIMLSSPPELETMSEKMKIVGVERVTDDDYQAIHEIVRVQAAEKESLD